MKGKEEDRNPYIKDYSIWLMATRFTETLLLVVALQRNTSKD
jgi:hypothetical protein